MANSNTSSSGSQTQLLGSAESAGESLKIILFNQSLLSSKISLYGMIDYYNSVVLKGNYLEISRATINDAFEYNYRNGSIYGFDLIIYLQQADNSPVGFTEFNNVQGISRNILINIDITSVDETSSIYVNDVENLGQVKVTNLSLTLLGEENYKFTSSTNIINRKILNPKSSYTIHVEDLDNNKSIITNFGGVTSDGIYHYEILRNKFLDPHNIGFNNFSLCKHGTDIVLLEWTDDYKYSIFSMTVANRFGNPSLYSKDNLMNSIQITNPSSSAQESRSVGYCEIKKYPGSVNQNIVSLAGRYIIVDVDGKTKAYDAVSDKFMELDGQIVLDERAYTTGINVLESDYENYILGCPDILNLYLDISRLFSKNLSIYRKIGSWFILQYDYSTDTDMYICASPVNTIYLTKEDLKKLIIVNDDTILLKEDNYYVMYSGYEKTYYSERARNIVEGGALSSIEVQGVEIIFNSKGTYDSLYKDYYKDRNIEVVSKTDCLCNTVFNKYRKNIYPLEIVGIPDIIGAYDGLLFYKNGKIINYL